MANLQGNTAGERIRLARISKNLTLAAVARQAGIAETYLPRLEQGHYQPTIDTLTRLAKALSVSLP
ncbi:helix-turn-helix domain-containing protein [Acididesulfobacillus acetoxydans]|uniref:helix-turn-helix domain-containing protein n=1 Tax=Acididesulfobacillus acetoxydans TaxID=1561005 RepID=UPI00355677A3